MKKALISLFLTITSSIIGMDQAAQPLQEPCVFFVPEKFNEIPDTQLASEKKYEAFKVPLSFARACGPIRDCPAEVDASCVLRHPVSFNKKRVKEFVQYLILSAAPVEQDKNNFLKNLSDEQCIALGQNVSNLDVIGEGRTFLIDEMANRMMDPQKRQNFYVFNQTALHKELMQKWGEKRGKSIDFEKLVFQSNADGLTERQQIKRSMSILSCCYHNALSAVTALPRWLGGWQWTAKTTTIPQYLNRQTETIITSWIKEVGGKTQITHLSMLKKDGEYTVDVSVLNIEKIRSIESNYDESVFICHSLKDKQKCAFIISVEDGVGGEAWCRLFRTYAFTDTQDAFYVINDEGRFGIWNPRGFGDKGFVDCHPAENCNLLSLIKTNEDRSQVIICDGKCIFVGTKKSNSMDISWQSSTTILLVKDFCFHPIKKEVYIAGNWWYENKYVTELACINLEKLNIGLFATADGTVGDGSFFCFVPGTKNVLFFGTNNSFDKDYFFNTDVRGRFWTKKKSREITTDISTKKETNHYERIALTTDGQYSIERGLKKSILLDFFSLAMIAMRDKSTLSSSSSSSPFLKDVLAIKEIVACPLIDDSTINLAKLTQNGLMPLEAIGAADVGIITPELQAKIEQSFPHAAKVINDAMSPKSWWRPYVVPGFIIFAVAIIALFKDSENVYGVNMKKVTQYVVGLTLSALVGETITAQY